MEGAFELLHQFLRHPRWDPVAFDRAKQMFASHFRSTDKSLERATANRIMGAMIKDDRRFRDPTPEDIEALDLGEDGLLVTILMIIWMYNMVTW